MDPDATPEPEKTKASFNLPAALKNLLAPLKNLPAAFKRLPAALTHLATPLKNLPAALKSLSTPLKNLPAALTKLLPKKPATTVDEKKPPAEPKKPVAKPKKPPAESKKPAPKPPKAKKPPAEPKDPTAPNPENLATAKKLAIPKKLMIPVIAGAVLLTAGGVAFGLFHAKLKHAAAATTQVKAGASGEVVASEKAPSANGPSANGSSTPGSSADCSGVVRDIYRQTTQEDPSVTLAEVRSEVLSSGISCAPVPEIAAQLKDLSAPCRDMVQYTYLGAHDGHLDITVSDIREKVVQKSVACEHDRPPNIASAARHKPK